MLIVLILISLIKFNHFTQLTQFVVENKFDVRNPKTPIFPYIYHIPIKVAGLLIGEFVEYLTLTFTIMYSIVNHLHVFSDSYHILYLCVSVT